MGKGTLVFLLLLVLGLSALWLQKRSEEAGPGPTLDEYPLLPGFASERVAALRVDHLERAFEMKVERDSAGRWFMTDPVAYPAEPSLIRLLLSSLESARGEPAPEADPAQVGLDPPLAVLECVQMEDGLERRMRIEIGALDVNPSRIHVRIPDHPSAQGGGCDVFRTSRVLANTLERFPDDYRDRHVTNLQVRNVVSIRRRGQVHGQEEGRLIDLSFDALSGPDGWKRASPTVGLDPNSMGLLTRCVTELSIEKFADDSPTDLAVWGLDPPAFTVEIGVLSGSPVVLEFGSPSFGKGLPVGEVSWYCMRKGYAHVWEVGTRDVQLLTQEADLFYDQLVVRALRTDVARLELEGAGARRILERDGDAWLAWEEGQGASSSKSPGNATAIEEALALLERVQLAEHLPQEAFEPMEPPCGFTFQLRNGARIGGSLGRAARDPKSGAQGRQFQREGDEIPALIGDEVLELCQQPLGAFRSRKVYRFQESLVRSIELERAPDGPLYAFINVGDNVWNPRGQAIQAPGDFLQSLDGLLNLGAKRWLEEAPGSERLLGVRIQPLEGASWAFDFGRLPDGSTLFLGPNGQIAEVDGDLVERLLRLF